MALYIVRDPDYVPPGEDSLNRSVIFSGSYASRIEILANTAANPLNAIFAGDWTCSMRVRLNSGNNTAGISSGANVNWVSSNILLDRDRYNLNRSWGAGFAGRQFCLGLWDSAGAQYTWVSPLVHTVGQWYWIVVQRVRSSGAYRCWVDGARTVNAASGPTGDISYPEGAIGAAKDPYLTLGAEKHGIAANYSGYLTDLHFMSGLAVANTATIVEPGTWQSVVASTRALYLMREADGSAELRDSSNNVAPGVVFGGVSRSTVAPVFGATDGQSFTLNGTFTAKASPTPLAYDEFTVGTLGQPVNNRPATIGAWQSLTGSTPASTPYVTYSDVRSVKGGRSCRSDHTNAPNGNGSLYCDVSGGGAQTLYVDFWSYTDPVAGRSRNHKLWRVYGVSGGLDNNVEMGNEVWRGAVRTGEHGPDPPWHYTESIPSGNPGYQYDLPYRAWVHVEIEFRATPTGSFYRNWHDGILICEPAKLAASVPGGARIGVRLQNYWATDAADGYPSNPGCVSYTDVAMVDNTLQRVVICNAATFAAATRRAIQPSTAWSTTQIQVRVNTAGLVSGDSHWIMVMGPGGSTAAPEYVAPVTVLGL